MTRYRSLGAAGVLAIACAALAACAGSKPAVEPASGAVPARFTGTAWDNFNHRGNLMWACRDIASGDIVSNSLCQGLAKDDRQWPGMAVPPGYRGVSTD